MVVGAKEKGPPTVHSLRIWSLLLDWSDLYLYYIMYATECWLKIGTFSVIIVCVWGGGQREREEERKRETGREGEREK